MVLLAKHFFYADSFDLGSHLFPSNVLRIAIALHKHKSNRIVLLQFYLENFLFNHSFLTEEKKMNWINKRAFPWPFLKIEYGFL